MSIAGPHSVQPGNARVALVGAGTIGARYVESIQQTPGFEIVSVCSRQPENARLFAVKHQLSASSLDEMLNDPTINYVLNLSPAHAHAEISMACLRSGKSVYSEKPLASTLEEADALIEFAEKRSLLLACAPATFLWPPLVTARRLLDDGRLGKVVGALTTLVYPGPELFHPNPAHLYGTAAGPLHDMGVYQITALMALLGPVVAVSAMTSQAQVRRTVLVGNTAGASFDVHAPTHIHAQLQHANGTISSMIVSFDAVSAHPPQIDIFGPLGSLSISNFYDPAATLTIRSMHSTEPIAVDEPTWNVAQWAIGPIAAWNAYKSRTLIETNAHRARSVLEVMLTIEQAAIHGTVIQIAPSKAWL